MATQVTKPLKLSGRYFSKKDLIHVQQTVQSFPNLSLTELAQTLCENLNWKTANAKNKHNACLDALEKMKKLGLVQLPEKIVRKKRQTKKLNHTKQSRSQPIITGTLDDLGEIALKPLTLDEDIGLWKEYIDRYHYLGFKHPVGASLKYFIVCQNNRHKPQILGCLLLSSSVWQLSDRDKWIGWNQQDREQRLNLVVNNKRFLILPWVKITNLASKVLSLLAMQIQQDWVRSYHYQPVLLETFVDSDKYQGTCYLAANWKHIGQTSGKDWSSDNPKATTSKKHIFVYPLQANFKAVLKNIKPASQNKQLDSSFLSLWGKVVNIISEVAQDFDALWQKRKRVIDSLLMVFLIFRLVLSKNSQGYATTINEFWHHCHRMKFPLPQKTPISASSFSNARKKLDEQVFKDINKRIIDVYDNQCNDNYLWFSHRIFAVDGSKLNLPRQLLDNQYKLPTKQSYYPQGLLSCLYQLKTKIPYDFDLVPHGNERNCALAHLKKLNSDDVIVYDRGYFSYAMLYYHIQSGIHPVFRLRRKLMKEIDAFINGTQTDTIITLTPSKRTLRNIHKRYPDIQSIPLRIRLLRYTLNGAQYYLGTTLTEPSYTIKALQDLYHGRWGIEELYKVSKQLIAVDDFHGKTERGIKQELFAHFVLITMSRLCSNKSEHLLNNLINLQTPEQAEGEKKQVNFKHTLSVLSLHLEEIMFVPARYIKNTMDEIMTSVSRYYQKVRPNRCYARRSLKPQNKWRSANVSR